MLRPQNEREALELELREELPAQLAAYRKDLDATPITFNERRERLEWQIRRAEMRLVTIKIRLATVRAEPS